MKSFLIILISILTLGCAPVEIDDYQGESDVSIMSFNLRYDEPSDGDNQWSNRKEACIQMLQEVKPTIMGIQEGFTDKLTISMKTYPIMLLLELDVTMAIHLENMQPCFTTH